MPDNTTVLDPRQAIEAETRHTATTLLYTAPVLDTAAALLADLWATGERHGVQPSDLKVAFDCLEATRPRWRTSGPESGGRPVGDRGQHRPARQQPVPEVIS